MLKNFDFEKTPVVEIVNDILLDSSRRGASDIHFDPYDEFIKVRIRIDGELSDYTEVPSSVAKNLITRIKIISGMNITESRLPQDGAIKATLEDVNLDLRVSSLPTNKGEKIVIRILDYTLSLAGLESLGLSEQNLKKVLKMISEPNGIILVTGATGSGKSTTVYSILQKLNKEYTNIISVEDPIEMDIQGINQIQTNSEIGLDFATVLRSILRQDPNVIMIGEIRDTETAKIAVRASITGHLVLSTLHTNDSLNTIERLLDMEVERYLLASALTGIISQKLARRLCDKCKTLKETNDYEKNIIKKVTGKEIDKIYTAVGCDHCKNGYDGRIAIHEILTINQDIKDAISSNVRKDKLRMLVYNEDLVSLLQDGIDKVLAGLTTLEELLKLIELDDDGVVKSTGLKKAIEMDELTKENIEETEGIIEELPSEKKQPQVNSKSSVEKEIKVAEQSEEPKIEKKIENSKIVEKVEKTKDEEQKVVENELFEKPETLTVDSTHVNREEKKSNNVEEKKENISFSGNRTTLFSSKKKFF